MVTFHATHSSGRPRFRASRGGIQPAQICAGVLAFALVTGFGLKSANPGRSITVAPPAGAPAGVSFGGNELSRAPEPAEAGIAGFEPRLAPQP